MTCNHHTLPLRSSVATIAFVVTICSHLGAQAPLTLGLIDSIRSTSSAVWSSNNRDLYLTSQGRVWKMSSETGEHTLISKDSGFSGAPRISRSRDYLAAAHRNEIWILNPSTKQVIARSRGDVDSRWDLAASGKEACFAGPGYLWSRVSKDGRQARVKISPEMFGLNQLLIDKSLVAGERGIVWVFSPYGSPIEWSPDGTRLYFLSAKTGWNKIWSLKADGSDLRQETYDDCDDRDFQILNDNSLIFVSNRREKVEWSLWHQHRGGTPAFLFGDWGTVQSPVVSPDGQKIAFLFSTPTQPADLYVLNRTNGASRQLTHNAPKTLFSHVVQARVISYPSVRSDIQGLLFVPPSVDSLHKAPAIIKLHGGPSMHDGLSWNSQLQYLASRGFVVLAVNYTGSVGYGKALEEADRFRIGYEDCDDVAAAARALQALPFVHPTRLGVCGSSYGGYLTNIVIGRYPRLFSAAVSWYGITNWFSNDAFPHLHPVVKYFFRDRLGQPATRATLYKSASPVTYADSVLTPLLLAHGDADTVVPIGQSQEFYRALRACGANVEFSTYRAEGHGWTRSDTKRDAFRRMEDWFTRYLSEE